MQSCMIEKKATIPVATMKGYVVKLVRLLFIACKNKKNAPTDATSMQAWTPPASERFTAITWWRTMKQATLLLWNIFERNTACLKHCMTLPLYRDLWKTDKRYLCPQSRLVTVSLCLLTLLLREKIMSLLFKIQGNHDVADYIYLNRKETVLDLNTAVLKVPYDMYPRKFSLVYRCEKARSQPRETSQNFISESSKE